MLRRIVTIEDVREELKRYFEIMRSIPCPKMPGYAQNHIWQMLKPEYEDTETGFRRVRVLGEDVADCWYIDEHWITLLSRTEYNLLESRCRLRPVPWKVLEKEYKLSRQMLNHYVKRALEKILYSIK